MDGHTDIVKMYPNPVVDGRFSIVTSKPGIKHVQVYNSAGALYRNYEFAEGAKDIITAGWAKGYYMVRFSAADGMVMTQQLSIQ
jgi:hypothetical protein